MSSTIEKEGQHSSNDMKRVGSTLSNYNVKPTESIFYHTQIMLCTLGLCSALLTI